MSIAHPILVVDDDPSIVEFVSEALAQEGYFVVTANNGAVALELTRQYDPALVLLDMKMPVLDGLGFLARYCSQQGAPAPVIAMSAHIRMPLDLVCARTFLEKPFNLDDLLGTIEQTLSPKA